VWSDGLKVRYSADGSLVPIGSVIPIWIGVGDLYGDDNRADIIGSYKTGTWYWNPSTGAWAKIATTAEQVTSGDINGDGRDDLIGIWSDGVWVLFGKTGQWQKITSSKPKWISTGKTKP